MINLTKFDKSRISKFLKEENDYIVDLLTNFNVPDSIEDINYKDYLLDNKGKSQKLSKDGGGATTVDELGDRLNTIKNKMKAKKRKVSEKSLKRREAKKLKKNKEYKKVLKTAHSKMTAENIKPENGSSSTETKKDIKKVIPKPIFNAEGKMVFSKFDFAAHPGAKAKKSKKDKVMKNPRQILHKMKETDKKLQSLKEQGDEDKVKELVKDMAWKKAFDKTDGKKVKDDPKLLYKAIKRQKIEKKKSKQKWVERKKKVEQTIQNKQKKRTENINKKIKDKKNKKLKKFAKKGRIIPGF